MIHIFPHILAEMYNYFGFGKMVVPVQQAGGSMVRFGVESLTLTSGMEGVREEGGEPEVKGQRKRETDCQSGALMKKMERWVPLTLLEHLCLSRCV